VRKECRTRDVTSLQLDVSQKGNWRRRSIRDWINAQRFPPFGLAETESLGSDGSSGGIAAVELHHGNLTVIWTSGDTLVLVLAKASIVGYSKNGCGQLGLAFANGRHGDDQISWFSPCPSASACQASRSPGGPRACAVSGHRSARMSSPRCTGDTAPSACARYGSYLHVS
jgi:hypothetical protein